MRAGLPDVLINHAFPVGSIIYGPIVSISLARSCRFCFTLQISWVEMGRGRGEEGGDDRLAPIRYSRAYSELRGR